MKWLIPTLINSVKGTWLVVPVGVICFLLWALRMMIPMATIGTLDMFIGLLCCIFHLKEPKWVAKVRPWVYGEFAINYIPTWGWGD